MAALEPEVTIPTTLEDADAIADHLTTLAEIDAGENTDYDELIRLRDLVREAAHGPGVI